ncbi:MAG TPA: outer membrane beta-barrel protein [Caulobacteraceae bacterium]|nr:outer membrane beta-barrel protein [Caulobacteraceae bacterium]
MLRKILMASAIAAACAAVPAIASAAPAQNWTGFYVGVNGGYGGDKVHFDGAGTYTDYAPDPDLDSPAAVSAKANATSSGFIGGAQVGYNFMVSDNLIVGAEADIDVTDIKAQADLSGTSTGGATGTASAKIGSKIDYLGTVRARVGMPMFEGRFVPYLAGGLAYGRVHSYADASFSGFLNEGSTSTGSFSLDHTKTQTGWTLGGGADYALTDRLSFRAEYLYVDLGKDRIYNDSFDINDGYVDAVVDMKTTANIVRVGMNYRF